MNVFKVTIFLVFAGDHTLSDFFKLQVDLIKKSVQKISNHNLDINVVPLVYPFDATKDNQNLKKYRQDIRNEIERFSKSNNLAIFYYSGHGTTTSDPVLTQGKVKYAFEIDADGKKENSYLLGKEIYNSVLKINEICPTVLLFNTCTEPNFDGLGRTMFRLFFNKDIAPPLLDIMNNKFNMAELINIEQTDKRQWMSLLDFFEKTKPEKFSYTKDVQDKYDKVKDYVRFHDNNKHEKNLSIIYSFDQKPFDFDPALKKIEMGPNVICELFEKKDNFYFREFAEAVLARLKELTKLKGKEYNPILEIISSNSHKAIAQYNAIVLKLKDQ